MDFGSLKVEVGRRLAEVQGRLFWTEAEIGEAVNLGLQELADSTEFYEQHLDIELLNDRAYYDLRHVIGPDFLALRPAYNEQTNRWLIPSTVRHLDAHDRRWERVTGEPQRIVLRGLWWLGLYPRVQADAGRIRQYYVALPPALVEDEDEPPIPEAFQEALIDFGLADLFAIDGESAFALAAWARYLAGEADLAAWVEHRAADPMRHGFEGVT